jgi:hypothetical protein
MEEKKVREDYLEFPWGIEDTIENLRELKSVLQRQVRETNCDGKGAQDAFEVGFDFDRAIEALEKQLPKKGIKEKITEGINKGLHNFYCPVCYEKGDLSDKCNVGEYCSDCGQRLDWGDDRA